ncbi:MAG: ATP-binding cassette domain-containing protein, partial [Erysipelotrichaceae bacterium]|nr:ATP-binding cassette domain-containing protein [Erysipelotrichaceae bacterium]
MSLIEIKDLSYSYNETNKAVDGVSLKIEKGSYTTVIGHNGSGKSTLAKLIAGLLPIKQGEVIINGLQMNEANLPEIRKELGIVFQNP